MQYFALRLFFGILLIFLGWGTAFAQHGINFSNKDYYQIRKFSRSLTTDQVVPKDEFDNSIKTNKDFPNLKKSTTELNAFLQPTADSEKIKRCNDLSRQLMDALRISDQAPSKLQATFTSECMRDLFAFLPDNKQNELEKKLASILGTFFYGQDNSFCTGFRIQADVVGTAKHCFYGRDTGELLQMPRSVKFQPAGSKLEFDVKPIDCYTDSKERCEFPQSVASFSTINDFLMLRVPALKGIPMPNVEFEQMVIPGEAVLVAGISTDLGGEGKYLVDDTPSGCKVGFSEGNCIYHSCSTGRGYSGSPLLRLTTRSDKSNLVIVGVHIEGVGVKGSQCTSSVMRGVGNAALSINPKKLLNQKGE